MKITFCKEDVYAIDVRLAGCCECTDGDETSEPKGTKAILLDLRILGQTTALDGRYCEPCAAYIVSRIQESLPENIEG